MLTLVFAVLCLITNALAFLETGYPAVSHQAHTNLTCAPDETPCFSGCCPLPNAFCCQDGFICCRRDQVCHPFYHYCIGLEAGKNGEPVSVPAKPTPVRHLVTPCPSGTTECSPGKCCVFEDAVCCSDGQHCCPSGYRCDVSEGRCMRNSGNDLYDNPTQFLGTKASLTQPIHNKPSHKTCPGGHQQCPSYTSCCLNDQGVWGCCPNPALNGLYRAGGGECCNTIFGYICCPEEYPHCTILACAK